MQAARNGKDEEQTGRKGEVRRNAPPLRVSHLASPQRLLSASPAKWLHAAHPRTGTLIGGANYLTILVRIGIMEAHNSTSDFEVLSCTPFHWLPFHTRNGAVANQGPLWPHRQPSVCWVLDSSPAVFQPSSDITIIARLWVRT